jgi:hypothetical protein
VEGRPPAEERSGVWTRARGRCVDSSGVDGHYLPVSGHPSFLRASTAHACAPLGNKGGRRSSAVTRLHVVVPRVGNHVRYKDGLL